MCCKDHEGVIEHVCEVVELAEVQVLELPHVIVEDGGGQLQVLWCLLRNVLLEGRAS